MGPIYRFLLPGSRQRGLTTVFRYYNDCIMAWLLRTQTEGYGGGKSKETGGYRMYFSGDTIFSYGEHFPLARIFHVGEVLYTLVNVEKSTPTTRGHQQDVRSTIQSMHGDHAIFEATTAEMNAFSMSRPHDAPNCRRMIYAYYEHVVRAALDDASRARSEGRKRDHLDLAERYVRMGNRFATLFGDVVPFPTNPEEADAVQRAQLIDGLQLLAA